MVSYPRRSHRHFSAFCLWLERRLPHIPSGRLRSLLRLGKFAGLIANAALFYGLAIGTLRHHLLPMVRVDAPAPAKIRCVHSLRLLTIQDLELNLWPQQHSQRRALRVSLGQFQRRAKPESPWKLPAIPRPSRGSHQTLVLPEILKSVRR